MNIIVRPYSEKDIASMQKIWNGIVEEGRAFPQTETLTDTSARDFFASQSYCGVAEDADSGTVVGMYILHPNNVGRCGHIANASYGVSPSARGFHVGESLVRDCMARGKQLGFRILQFNAVVKTNLPARRLYEKLGFVKLGVIPGGFLMPDGSYEDICPYYILL